MLFSYKEYCCYVDTAKDYDTLDKFMNEVGYTMGDWVPLCVAADVCKVIYAVNMGDFAMLLNVLGLRVIDFRTVQSWKERVRTVPDYVMRFIGYVCIVGLLEDVVEDDRV